MEVLNFDGVDVTADKSITRPGTIDVFKITSLKVESSKNTNTPYIKVQFENQDSSFNHSFFLAGKDPDKTKKVLARVQTLLVAIGGESNRLSGKVTSEQLTAKLLNKEVALKVSGEVSSNGKGFPTLSYAGFCKSKEEVEFLKFTKDEQTAIDEALEAIQNSRSSNADAETSSYSSDAPTTDAPINEEF